MSTLIEERLATLETKVSRVEKQLELLEDIRNELTKYRGFIGGVVFLATCFSAFLYQVKDWFKIKIGV